MDRQVVRAASILDAIREAGWNCDKSISADRFTRFPTGSKNDQNGYAKLFPDGTGGVFGCHTGEHYTWQSSDKPEPRSPAEKAAFDARRQQAEAEYAAIREADYRRAAIRANEDWHSMPLASQDNPYLVRKGVKPHGSHQTTSGNLLLAIYNEAGEIQSYQTIAPDGAKRFLSGGKLTGGRYTIGSPKDGVLMFITEGFATGASIHEATNACTVVAFSGANMTHVAASIRKAFPKSPITIAGDLDSHGAGARYAEAAAKACGGRVVFPNFADGRSSGDFNDLHKDEGLAAVASQLTAPLQKRSPIDELERFEVTQAIVDELSGSLPIWRRVIVRGHMQSWNGPAGSGKTAVAKLAASELAAAGYDVFYFQEDAGGGDLRELYEHAKAGGYRLLNSSLTNNSIDGQLAALRAMTESPDYDLTNAVFIFDTTKKFVELMSKGATREFNILIRGLTAKGATVVLLGHTNKHKGADGKLIFEGTGDIRSDVDELIYIESGEKDANGKVIVTMTPDKVRAKVEEISFELDTDSMVITPLARSVNVQRRNRIARDQPLIDAVIAMLKDGGISRSKLIERLGEDQKLGRRTAAKLIDDYASSEPADGYFWLQTKIKLHNQVHISLPPGSNDQVVKLVGGVKAVTVVKPVQGGQSGQSGLTADAVADSPRKKPPTYRLDESYILRKPLSPMTLTTYTT